MGLFNIFKRNRFEIPKSDLQSKKTLFYELSKKYFDLGLLKEVYSSDKISICNLANSMYLAFPFDSNDEENVAGVVINIRDIKNIIKNNDLVYNITQAYYDENQTKYIVELNDGLIEVFTPIMEKRSAPGCESSDVDLKLDEELINKYKKTN